MLKHARTISTLRDLIDSLNENGELQSAADTTPPPTAASKASLACPSLDEEHLSSFCANAMDTVAQNLLGSFKICPESFAGTNLRSTSVAVSKLGSASDLTSAIGLSLLVHASKFTSKEDLRRFMSLAVALSSYSYRMAAESEIPNDKFLEKGKSFLCDTVLSESILEKLPDVTVDDIRSIKIYFVHVTNEFMNGWCVPNGVALNVYALRNKATLEHHVAFAVLCGHEIRHALERKCADNNINFSTPEKSSQPPKLPENHRESGLGFVLRAIGEKYSYPSLTGMGDLVIELLTAIEEGIQKKSKPALTSEVRVKFQALERPYNGEMAFDCEDWHEGRVFTG